MSGIIVGIDGSSHSQIALEWAMREAVTRRVPLTVSQVAHHAHCPVVVVPGDCH